MEPPEASQRLLALSRERSVTLAQLSRLIGRNTTYLQQFVRKGSPRKLEETDRRTLARFLDVDEGELGAPEENSHVGAGARGLGWVAVPRLAVGASAGAGAFGMGEEEIGALRFSARWLRDLGFDPATLSAIAVEGDSMEPTLRDGDEIMVDRTPRPLRDGIHVVRVGETLLVKRLETRRAGMLTLISDNHAYPPLMLPLGEVEVVGRVVWKGGRL